MTHISEKPEQSGASWQPYTFKIQGENPAELKADYTAKVRAMKEETGHKSFVRISRTMNHDRVFLVDTETGGIESGSLEES